MVRPCHPGDMTPELVLVCVWCFLAGVAVACGVWAWMVHRWRRGGLGPGGLVSVDLSPEDWATVEAVLMVSPHHDGHRLARLVYDAVARALENRP